MQKTYRVSGPFAFRGHEPGSTFEADTENKLVARAVERGAISEESPAAAPESTTETDAAAASTPATSGDAPDGKRVEVKKPESPPEPKSPAASKPHHAGSAGGKE